MSRIRVEVEGSLEWQWHRKGSHFYARNKKAKLFADGWTFAIMVNDISEQNDSFLFEAWLQLGLVPLLKKHKLRLKTKLPKTYKDVPFFDVPFTLVQK